jgi:hypothetical protein
MKNLKMKFCRMFFSKVDNYICSNIWTFMYNLAKNNIRNEAYNMIYSTLFASPINPE